MPCTGILLRLKSIKFLLLHFLLLLFFFFFFHWSYIPGWDFTSSKISMTCTKIETAIGVLVVQCLKQLRYRVPLIECRQKYVHKVAIFDWLTRKQIEIEVQQRVGTESWRNVFWNNLCSFTVNGKLTRRVVFRTKIHRWLLLWGPFWTWVWRKVTL